ncbi:MAG TPA: cytochrome c [Anaerolineales bacterium]|nr:cytochrome c [Anaerolineales bacterium]
MKTMARITVVVVIVMLAAGVAAAQFVKPDDAIQYRKAVMVLIGQHFKRMGAVVQGKMPYDPDTFAANAALVETLATLPWEAVLTPGSEKGETTLSPAVFAKGDELKQTADQFETAAASLAQTAQSGNLDAIKGDFNAVAQSCKSCHDAFRK